ncbi:MAG TPA: hypothetical protein VLE27_13780 [Thermoanaerobaculia bacterium]|nr:hypothetical protein [Thermoanaerobaculia bacterium]
MIKRMGMLAVAFTLSAFAFAGSSQPAQAVCTGPLCFASPGCCFDWQCAEWCKLEGLGAPKCGGTPQTGGGCCSCEGAES